MRASVRRVVRVAVVIAVSMLLVWVEMLPFALWGGNDLSKANVSVRAVHGWPCTVPDSFPKQPERVRTREAIGYSEDGYHFVSSFVVQGYVTNISFGWPVRTFQLAECVDPSIDVFKPRWHSVWESGFVIPQYRYGWRVPDRALISVYSIPIRPVWPGFMALTALHAAAIWSVSAARRVKGWRRARRGLCRGCGYDVRGVVVCPECGAGVK